MNKLLIALVTTAFCFAFPAYAKEDGMGEHCQMHNKKTFEEADADNDGTLDREEAKHLCQMNFDKMDTDHDGTLTKEELRACGRGKKGGMHDKGSQQFDAADKDHDGTLDKEEARKLPRIYKNFDAIDVNKDGTVDRKEVHNYMKEHKRK